MIDARREMPVFSKMLASMQTAAGVRLRSGC